MVARLTKDDSLHALRNPTALVECARTVASFAYLGTASSTHKDDKPHREMWSDFCTIRHGTDPVRPTFDCTSGILQRTYDQRESVLQTEFLIRTHFGMRPRRAADPAARPASAIKYLYTVRRIHREMGTTLHVVPSLGLALKGLWRAYVQLHGTESLKPYRKSPLSNEQAAAILRVPDGTRLWREGLIVQSDSPMFVSFKAFLTMISTVDCGRLMSDLRRRQTSIRRCCSHRSLQSQVCSVSSR